MYFKYIIIVMAALESIPYSFFSSEVVIYFFIGRMNPPHAGHEAALRQMMELASAERSIPLILVGSGPNKGERTLNDPLTFSNKRRILQYRLSGSLCEIREKTEPVRDVVEWTLEVMRNVSNVKSVTFKLVTGDKDGNATKLDWIHKAILKKMEEKMEEMHIHVPCRWESVAIRAEKSNGVEMSATKVRQDALSAHLSHDDSFSKYSGYYGPHTENVYGEITEIAQKEEPASLRHYVETGELIRKRSKTEKVEKEEKAEKIKANSNAKNAKKAKTQKAKVKSKVN